MYTMEDFKRDLFKKYFPQLTHEEQRDVLEAFSPGERLAGLSREQIQQYLDQLTDRPTAPPKPRRKRSGGSGGAGSRTGNRK